MIKIVKNVICSTSGKQIVSLYGTAVYFKPNRSSNYKEHAIHLLPHTIGDTLLTIIIIEIIS